MIWQDAQRQYVGIVHRPQKLTVLHVVTKAEAIVATAHPILRIVVVAVAVSLAEVQGRADRDQVRLCCTQPAKFSYSHQFEMPLRHERRCPELRDVFLFHARVLI